MATCFVSMPFGAPFDACYKQVLVRAILRAGLEPTRADDLDRPRAIVEQIGSGVSEATVCVIDVTRRNAGVLYALGMAHALNKPVVHLAQSTDDLPFDLRFARHIVYHPGAARWEDMLSLQVESAVRESMAVSP